MICLAVAAGFVARESLSKDSGNQAAVSADSQEPSGRGPVRMIRFVLSDDGLYPRRMRVDHGLINIALEDRTHRSEGLLVESVLEDQRAKVTEVKRNEKQWRGRTLVRLAPGRYLVSDASQPGLTAELIVSP
jgi:hypothetical protein